MDDPRIATSAQDFDRDAVYQAEAYWQEAGWGEYTVPSADVVDYMVAALRTGGWRTSDRPVVVFDVPDDSDWSAMHRPSTDTIHLHPKLTSLAIVLHELAHWLSVGRGHGSRFQAIMIMLVDATLGEQEAQELLWSYEEEGLDPDRFHLPDWASGG